MLTAKIVGGMFIYTANIDGVVVRVTGSRNFVNNSLKNVVIPRMKKAAQ